MEIETKRDSSRPALGIKKNRVSSRLRAFGTEKKWPESKYFPSMLRTRSPRARWWSVRHPY
jgi:hypothetical protein